MNVGELFVNNLISYLISQRGLFVNLSNLSNLQVFCLYVIIQRKGFRVRITDGSVYGDILEIEHPGQDE